MCCLSWVLCTFTLVYLGLHTGWGMRLAYSSEDKKEAKERETCCQKEHGKWRCGKWGFHAPQKSSWTQLKNSFECTTQKGWFTNLRHFYWKRTRSKGRTLKCRSLEIVFCKTELIWFEPAPRLQVATFNRFLLFKSSRHIEVSKKESLKCYRIWPRPGI